MSLVTVKTPTKEELFKAGAYLGHKKDKTSPKLRNFIYRVQSGVSIINLDKTEEKLADALELVEKTAKKGKDIIFIGTKSQIKEIIENAAKSCGMPYVTERWIGGTLTNFNLLRKNVEDLKKLEEDKKNKQFEGLTKKEKKGIDEVIKKGNKMYGGVKEMRKIPELAIVFDVYREKIAVKEAKKAGAKIIGLNDMEYDAKLVDKFIPINDESRKTIKLIADVFAKVIKENRE